MKKITEKEMLQKAKELEPYENKWVALVDDKVVTSGDSPREVEEKVEAKGYTDVVYHLVSSFRKIYIFAL